MKGQINDITIASFKKGDARAFKDIYNHFYPSLCYFAEKLTGDQEEAKDIVIETFTKLFQRFQNFETYTNIRAFLYITGRNASFNMLKTANRVNSRQKAFIDSLDQAENLEDELAEGEVLRLIYEAIETLPTECKKVFKLIYFEGMNHADIAGLLKISVHTVRNHRKRAIDLIRTKLSQKHYTILLWLLGGGLLYYLHDSDKIVVS